MLNKEQGIILVIEQGVIKQDHLFGKKMILADVKEIKQIAGDYILRTGKTKMTINTLLINEDALADLNAELMKLNVARRS